MSPNWTSKKKIHRKEVEFVAHFQGNKDEVCKCL